MSVNCSVKLHAWQKASVYRFYFGQNKSAAFFRFSDYSNDFQHNSDAFKLASAFALWRLLRINFEENWGKLFSTNLSQHAISHMQDISIQ